VWRAGEWRLVRRGRLGRGGGSGSGRLGGVGERLGRRRVVIADVL